VLTRRRIYDEFLASRLTDADMDAALRRLNVGDPVAQEGPLAMIAVAQLYARDVPDLPCPEDMDLLQVLWCPFEHDDLMPVTVLRWRRAADVTDPVSGPSLPSVVGCEDFMPQPCEVHPEPVIEYPAPHELPEELQQRIWRWEETQGFDYQFDLGVAPGWKVGGHAPWSFRDPEPMVCAECGSSMRPLLYVDCCEWDGGTLSWKPTEDPGLDEPGGRCDIGPRINVSGDGMQIYICPVSYTHPLIQNMQ
jgi:hypothetical protein